MRIQYSTYMNYTQIHGLDTSLAGGWSGVGHGLLRFSSDKLVSPCAWPSNASSRPSAARWPPGGVVDLFVSLTSPTQCSGGTAPGQGTR